MNNKLFLIQFEITYFEILQPESVKADIIRWTRGLQDAILVSSRILQYSWQERWAINKS